MKITVGSMIALFAGIAFGTFLFFMAALPNHLFKQNKELETVVVVEQRLPVFEFCSYRVKTKMYSELTVEQKSFFIIPNGYKLMYEYMGTVLIGADCSNLKVEKIGDTIYIENLPEAEILAVEKTHFKLISATQDSFRSIMGRGIPIQDIFDSINMDERIRDEVYFDGVTIEAARENLIKNLEQFYSPFAEKVVVDRARG